MSAPEQCEKNDDRDRYAKQPKQNSTSHLNLPCVLKPAFKRHRTLVVPRILGWPAVPAPPAPFRHRYLPAPLRRRYLPAPLRRRYLHAVAAPISPRRCGTDTSPRRYRYGEVWGNPRRRTPFSGDAVGLDRSVMTNDSSADEALTAVLSRILTSKNYPDRGDRVPEINWVLSLLPCP